MQSSSSSVSSSDARARDTGAQNDDVCASCCVSAAHRCADDALRRDVVCVCYGEDVLLKAPAPEACGRFVRWRAADRCGCDSADACGDAQLSHQNGPATLLCNVTRRRRIVAELLLTPCATQCDGCLRCVWLPCRLYDVRPRPEQDDFCLRAVAPPSAVHAHGVCLGDEVTFRVVTACGAHDKHATRITDLVCDYHWEPCDLVQTGQGTNEAVFATPRACALRVSVAMTLRGTKCRTVVTLDNGACPVHVAAPTPAARIALCDDTGDNVTLHAAAAPLAWADGTQRPCRLRWTATAASGAVFAEATQDALQTFAFDISGQVAPISVQAYTIACAAPKRLRPSACDEDATPASNIVIVA